MFCTMIMNVYKPRNNKNNSTFIGHFRQICFLSNLKRRIIINTSCLMLTHELYMWIEIPPYTINSALTWTQKEPPWVYTGAETRTRCNFQESFLSFNIFLRPSTSHIKLINDNHMGAHTHDSKAVFFAAQVVEWQRTRGLSLCCAAPAESNEGEKLLAWAKRVKWNNEPKVKSENPTRLT